MGNCDLMKKKDEKLHHRWAFSSPPLIISLRRIKCVQWFLFCAIFLSLVPFQEHLIIVEQSKQSTNVVTSENRTTLMFNFDCHCSLSSFPSLTLSFSLLIFHGMSVVVNFLCACEKVSKEKSVICNFTMAQSWKY